MGIRRMDISPRGIDALVEREGLRMNAYQDIRGIWTIGVGHTAEAGPPHPYPGLALSEIECKAILHRDLASVVESLNDNIWRQPTQNQFDAYASFAFNVGINGFEHSHSLFEFNLGNFEAAADALRSWIYAGTHVSEGLRNRRESERKQFLTPDPPETPHVATPERLRNAEDNRTSDNADGDDESAGKQHALSPSVGSGGNHDPDGVPATGVSGSTGTI